jgi:hypothetical protein
MSFLTKVPFSLLDHNSTNDLETSIDIQYETLEKLFHPKRNFGNLK